MAEIKCFFLVPIEKMRRSLRRYGGQCPGPWGYCNAETFLEDFTAHLNTRIVQGEIPNEQEKQILPFPAYCEHCSRAFDDGTDNWQIRNERLFERQDTKEVMTLNDAPPGAMWWAPWLAEFPGSLRHQGRGGGPHLILRTPGGDWDLDSKASNGVEGWERSGEPPNVTANPSIGFPNKDGSWKYHGWLKNGVLIDA